MRCYSWRNTWDGAVLRRWYRWTVSGNNREEKTCHRAEPLQHSILKLSRGNLWRYLVNIDGSGESEIFSRCYPAWSALVNQLPSSTKGRRIDMWCSKVVHGPLMDRDLFEGLSIKYLMIWGPCLGGVKPVCKCHVSRAGLGRTGTSTWRHWKKDCCRLASAGTLYLTTGLGQRLQILSICRKVYRFGISFTPAQFVLLRTWS